MAQIKPFKALRFTDKAGEISKLCCPPYDIISEDERKAYIAENEHNIIRLELPREGENPYQQAAKTLKQFEAEGMLKCDDSEKVYIYGESFNVDGVDYAFKGIIARVKLEEFSKKIVLPHEETLSKAKADRFELMKATMCNFSQIYSLYHDDGASTADMIEKLSAGEPEQCFTDGEGTTHSLWTVEGDAAVQICEQFAERRLYIADGHHRYETALNFRNWLRENGKAVEGDECDYCMMMLVAMDSPGLVVFPTHRIVRDLPDFDSKKLLESCEGTFDIETVSANNVKALLKSRYEAGEKAFALYDGKEYSLMTLKDYSALDAVCPDCSRSLKELDVTVLHTLVLEKVLGIDKANMAAQINLTYTRVFDEAVQAVDSSAANCSFLMNPTKVEEISMVASAGEKMPQKSTYFYPKLITGLVMNKFGEIE